VDEMPAWLLRGVVVINQSVVRYMHWPEIGPDTIGEENMSRKHYKALAEIINTYTAASRPGTLHEHDAFDRLVENMASMFATDNPNFDRNRFYAAITEYGPNWD
jgi:hypothetical protein